MLSEYRKKVLIKIQDYEKKGLFNTDVESDPPSATLNVGDVDYLNSKISSKFLTFLANKAAIRFYEKKIKNGDMIIKEIKGLENFRSVKGGAILTCNHFNICDNYAVYRAIRKELPKGRKLYKVIKEENFTGYKGLYGFLFRHCNTLPLSKNFDVLRQFYRAMSTLLSRGEKILIYPEQSMWWNYKKPRPLKNGAFKFAVSNNVPVIPVFITMEDTEKNDAEGCPIKAYTLHFLPPIYPKKDYSAPENVEYMKNKNFDLWKEVYEREYNTKLIY